MKDNKIKKSHYDYVKRRVKMLELKENLTQKERIKRAEYLAEMYVYEKQNKGGKF